MARVRIEDIIDCLDREICQALEAAVKQTLPDAEFESFELFRAFSWAVRNGCHTWETVPDRLVDLPAAKEVDSGEFLYRYRSSDHAA